MNTEIYDQVKFPLGSVMNGANLFKFNPQLFDRRLENHRFHKRVTGKQREEYLDSLPCVLCGRKGGSCDCDAEKPRKKKKPLNL